MCSTRKNLLLLGNMGHNLKKLITLRKNVPHLEKSAKLVEKWVTLEKMCHTRKNVTHLKDVLHLKNICQTWKNVDRFANLEI